MQTSAVFTIERQAADYVRVFTVRFNPAKLGGYRVDVTGVTIGHESGEPSLSAADRWVNEALTWECFKD